MYCGQCRCLDGTVASVFLGAVIKNEQLLSMNNTEWSPYGCFVNNKCIRKWKDGNNQTCNQRYGRSVSWLDTVVGPGATIFCATFLRVRVNLGSGQSQSEKDAHTDAAFLTVLQSTTDSAQPQPTTDSARVQHPLIGSLIQQHWRD
jgi:hypothetical protein